MGACHLFDTEKGDKMAGGLELCDNIVTCTSCCLQCMDKGGENVSY